MRIKPVVTVVLALFVVVSVAVVLKRQAFDGRASEPVPGRVAEAAPVPIESAVLEGADQETAAPLEPDATVESTAPAPPAAMSAHAGKPKPVAPESLSVATQPKRRVLAFYFHGNVRCATCRKIEDYAREAVEQGFPEGLAEGSIVFQPVNVELPENRHYIDDFHLVTRTVVIAEEVDGVIGQWSRLDEVWQLVGQHDAYLEYVRGVVSEFLDRA